MWLTRIQDIIRKCKNIIILVGNNNCLRCAFNGISTKYKMLNIIRKCKNIRILVTIILCGVILTEYLTSSKLQNDSQSLPFTERADRKIEVYSKSYDVPSVGMIDRKLNSYTTPDVNVKMSPPSHSTPDPTVTSQQPRKPVKLHPCTVAANTRIFRINKTIPYWSDVENGLQNVQNGGSWRPLSCKARRSVAVVIPYRNRKSHLKVFLRHMHPFLQRQMIDYTIFVIEQTGSTPFNRGMLMNIGFTEAMRRGSYECYIFHDVDLLPEHPRNAYTCERSPIHKSVLLENHNYKIYYKWSFGGVTAFTRADFIRVNGYSNLYFGWGSEDDDLYLRVMQKRMPIVHEQKSVARYRTLSHAKARESNERMTLFQTALDRQDVDGLTSLKYDLQSVEHRKLFTLIKVHIDRAKVSRHATDHGMRNEQPRFQHHAVYFRNILQDKNSEEHHRGRRYQQYIPQNHNIIKQWIDDKGRTVIRFRPRSR